MIPKTIHYCWFGYNEKSQLIKDCISSWAKYYPDYKIIEWNESNFDINCNQYVREAYSQKKWAFVSDYCRMWVIYNYGGVYFDTDVELIKASNIFERPVVCFESERIINPGLVISGEKGNWFCKEMLESYVDERFMVDGRNNYKTICDRATEIFVKYGLSLNNKYQEICGYHILPSDYFNPLGYGGNKLRITKNTVGIHKFLASWQDENTWKEVNLNLKGKIFMRIKMILGEKSAIAIRRFFHR